MVSLKSRQKKIQGFLYLTEDSNRELFETPVGEKFIKPNRQPPWLVVNHTLDGVLVTKWSGRLLKVQILDQDTEKDINKGLVKDIWYTRTMGIEIIEEIPCETLFNPEGSVITKILDFTTNMTQDDANILSQFNLVDAYKIYSNTWNRWLTTQDPSSIHLNQDHSNTLAIYPKNSRNTLNRSFSVISNLVSKRAKELLGELAFTLDEDGEYILSESWAYSRDALMQAAMAFHGQEFVSNEERKVLLKPWNSVANSA